MIQPMIYSLTFIASIIFMQMNHPLAMGLVLLIQTILISVISGMVAKSFWFSYIMFLIFVGGMLVLFIYVTSLASNEMFTLSSKLMFMSSVVFMMITLTVMLMDKTTLYSLLSNNEMDPISSMISYTPENSIHLNKLYNAPTNYVTILLINYLLISLIAMVKITNIYQGPLRQMS